MSDSFPIVASMNENLGNEMGTIFNEISLLNNVSQENKTDDETENERAETNVGKFAEYVIRIASIRILIIFCALLIIPVLKFAFGVHFIDKCPINPKIPIYLVVFGICGIVWILLFYLLVCLYRIMHLTFISIIRLFS